MIDEKRTIEKPWGGELIWAETKDYVGKILFIKKTIDYQDNITK